ncbi:flagellar hook-length control protein FliK [Andreesenia angusta]|uniref:Flagellar hook-length control protein FliK n=1 Tax=Andreesenia angusta TaxID=39480 RepID=A0A1S1V4Z5_9FIRM|nr:DUF6240 domain-containing protein [Andreesenia angusta]OHW61662.1 flagellar hook-length control protein FliK [Andreesenia angusta]
MIENRINSKYSNAISSYTSLSSSSRVVGTLIEKINNNIKLDLGDNRIFSIELVEDMDLTVGETVSIEKSNIKKSSLEKDVPDAPLAKSQSDFYSLLLAEFNAEISSENISALEKMDRHGIPLNSENFEAYRIARDSFRQIESSLSYDSAVALVQQDVDLESESIDSVARRLSDISSELEGTRRIEVSGGSELSTEQAEDIALEIYGSRMGKDITDIIKALHREGLSISKKNIDKINDTFYKLNDLRDVKDATFVEALGDELDISIDTLYRLKNYSAKLDSSELSEADMIRLQKMLSKSYSSSSKSPELSDSVVQLSDEDISEFLKSIGVEASPEYVDMAKKLVIHGIEVNTENLAALDHMKQSLSHVLGSLDYENSSALGSIGVDIENTDLRELSAELKLMKNSPEITETELLSLLKRSQDIKVSELPKISLSSEPAPEIKSIADISDIFSNLERLDLNAISVQIKRNLPLTLSGINEGFLTAESSTALEVDRVDSSAQNMRRIDEVYRSFQFLKAELTTAMVSKSVSESISLEHVDIVVASRYVEQYRDNMLKFERDKSLKAESLKESLSEISSSGDDAALLVLKSKKPLLLSEIRSAHALLANKDQLGHKLSEFSSLTHSEKSGEALALLQKLKESVSAIYRSLSRSRDEVEASYRDMEQQLKNMESSSSLFGRDEELARGKLSEAFEKLDENRRLSQENKIVQLPVYMNGQFSNLNMYFRDRKQRNSAKDPDDISAVISIDTANMGNLNIGLEVESKSISLKVGVENLDYKNSLEKSIGAFSTSLEELGYSLASLDFHELDGASMLDNFTSESESAERPKVMHSGAFDLKI